MHVPIYKINPTFCEKSGIMVKCTKTMLKIIVIKLHEMLWNDLGFADLLKNNQYTIIKKRLKQIKAYEHLFNQ